MSGRMVQAKNVVRSVCAKRYFAQNYANLMCVLLAREMRCRLLLCVCVGGWFLYGFLGGFWVVSGLPSGRFLWTSCTACQPRPEQTAQMRKLLGQQTKCRANRAELKTGTHTWPKQTKVAGNKTKHLCSEHRRPVNFRPRPRKKLKLKLKLQ